MQSLIIKTFMINLIAVMDINTLIPRIATIEHGHNVEIARCWGLAAKITPIKDGIMNVSNIFSVIGVISHVLFDNTLFFMSEEQCGRGILKVIKVIKDIIVEGMPVKVAILPSIVLSLIWMNAMRRGAIKIRPLNAL